MILDKDVITPVMGALIKADHGWSVQEQFIDTFLHCESFEDQNSNALEYIKDTIDEALNNDFFRDECNEMLHEYNETVGAYLNSL